jgi:non-specific serine/threonine protein kinase
MGAALHRFWHWRGQLSEGRDRLAVWLAGPTPAVSDAVRAGALWAAGSLTYLQGDQPAARAQLEECAALWRRVGDGRGLALALATLTLAAWRAGDPAARSLGEEAVACARAAGDRLTLARALHHFGTAVGRTDPGAARAALEESLALSQEVGNRWQCSVPLSTLALVARDSGDRTEARRRYEEALAIRRETGDRRGVASVLHNLGVLAAQEGDAPRAAAHFRESLALFRAFGDGDSLAWCLFGLAGTAAALGQPARAARILGAVSPYLTPGATTLHLPDPAARDRTLAAPRAALGEAAFAAAWAEGRALSLEQAAALAAKAAPEPATPAAAGGLSPREREVASLVAQGRSNREIAAALTITERTAENHVEHILAKLGFRSRAQVAVWAAQRGAGATDAARGSGQSKQRSCAPPSP